MTCIAGYTDGKTCAIAADSAIFESGDTNIWWPSSKPKIWRVNDALLGGAGESGALIFAENSKISDPYELATFLRERKDDVGDDFDIMVVTRRAIHMVWQDFSVAKMARNYHASGGASAPALGVLSVAKILKIDPLTAVKLAAKAACDHHVSARPPVVAKEIK